MTEEEQAAADKVVADKAAADKVAADKAAADKIEAEKKEKDDKLSKLVEDSDAAKTLIQKLETEKASLLKESMKRKQQNSDSATKLSEANTELDKLKAALGDVDIEGITKLIAQQTDAKTKALEAEGKYEQIVEQIKETHKTEVETLKAQLKEIGVKLTSATDMTEELSVGRAFSDSAFIKESSVLPATIARREFGQYFDIVGGKVVPFTKPRGFDGRVEMVDGEGIAKTFDAAIASLYENHTDSKSLIRTTQKEGAGSHTQDKKGGDKSSDTTLVGADRIAAALKAGALKKAV